MADEPINSPNTDGGGITPSDSAIAKDNLRITQAVAEHIGSLEPSDQQLLLAVVEKAAGATRRKGGMHRGSELLSLREIYRGIYNGANGDLAEKEVALLADLGKAMDRVSTQEPEIGSRQAERLKHKEDDIARTAIDTLLELKYDGEYIFDKTKPLTPQVHELLGQITATECSGWHVDSIEPKETGNWFKRTAERIRSGKAGHQDQVVNASTVRCNVETDAGKEPRAEAGKIAVVFTALGKSQGKTSKPFLASGVDGVVVCENVTEYKLGREVCSILDSVRRLEAKEGKLGKKPEGEEQADQQTKSEKFPADYKAPAGKMMANGERFSGTTEAELEGLTRQYRQMSTSTFDEKSGVRAVAEFNAEGKRELRITIPSNYWGAEEGHQRPEETVAASSDPRTTVRIPGKNTIITIPLTDEKPVCEDGVMTVTAPGTGEGGVSGKTEIRFDSRGEALKTTLTIPGRAPIDLPVPVPLLHEAPLAGENPCFTMIRAAFSGPSGAVHGNHAKLEQDPRQECRSEVINGHQFRRTKVAADEKRDGPPVKRDLTAREKAVGWGTERLATSIEQPIPAATGLVATYFGQPFFPVVLSGAAPHVIAGITAALWGASKIPVVSRNLSERSQYNQERDQVRQNAAEFKAGVHSELQAVADYMKSIGVSASEDTKVELELPQRRAAKKQEEPGKTQSSLPGDR